MTQEEIDKWLVWIISNPYSTREQRHEAAAQIFSINERDKQFLESVGIEPVEVKRVQEVKNG